MPPYCCKNVVFFNSKFKGRISVIVKLLSGDLNSHAEPLHISQDVHGFCKMWISIIRHAGLAKVFFCHLTERSPWIMYFNAIREPVNTGGSISSFIGSVKDRVADQLLKSRKWIL